MAENRYFVVICYKTVVEKWQEIRLYQIQVDCKQKGLYTRQKISLLGLSPKQMLYRNKLIKNAYRKPLSGFKSEKHDNNRSFSFFFLQTLSYAENIEVDHWGANLFMLRYISVNRKILRPPCQKTAFFIRHNNPFQKPTGTTNQRQRFHLFSSSP